ncbi:hypothetical protein X801_06189 [Opisthorchis viverrini]|uniref:Uncharacterized protein n=1 Tax=Opisthorchis viverrini TaxID=6198 RepID=A0A1S8WUP8_OPIVI|nr:hypothetical protein X801_06189 [Opisthorchis viverrini]
MNSNMVHWTPSGVRLAGKRPFGHMKRRSPRVWECLVKEYPDPVRLDEQLQGWSVGKTHYLCFARFHIPVSTPTVYIICT